MQMPEPNDNHRRLERLAGRWRGTETMHPSPWDPKGGTATGTNDSRIDLGGFALITNYEQQRDGAVTYAGHGVMTFDDAGGYYVLHWFDSMGSPAEVFKGDFVDDVLTVGHGGETHARLTYDLSREGVLGSTMEMSQDGEGWNTLYEAEYRRE